MSTSTAGPNSYTQVQTRRKKKPPDGDRDGDRGGDRGGDKHDTPIPARGDGPTPSPRPSPRPSPHRRSSAPPPFHHPPPPPPHVHVPVSLPMRNIRRYQYRFSIKWGKSPPAYQSINPHDDAVVLPPPNDFDGRCFLCQGRNHSQHYCPMQKCTTCGRYGHSRQKCPRRTGDAEYSSYYRSRGRFNTFFGEGRGRRSSHARSPSPWQRHPPSYFYSLDAIHDEHGPLLEGIEGHFVSAAASAAAAAAATASASSSFVPVFPEYFGESGTAPTSVTPYVMPVPICTAPIAIPRPLPHAHSASGPAASTYHHSCSRRSSLFSDVPLSPIEVRRTHASASAASVSVSVSPTPVVSTYHPHEETEGDIGLVEHQDEHQDDYGDDLDGYDGTYDASSLQSCEYVVPA